MAENVRDLEHRFDVCGRVYVAKVCSSDLRSASQVSAGAFDVQIVTCAADELSNFNNDDPEFLARRVVVDISTRMPNLPETELELFFNEVVSWISEYRRAAAEDAREDWESETRLMQWIAATGASGAEGNG